MYCWLPIVYREASKIFEFAWLVQEYWSRNCSGSLRRRIGKNCRNVRCQRPIICCSLKNDVFIGRNGCNIREVPVRESIKLFFPTKRNYRNSHAIVLQLSANFVRIIFAVVLGSIIVVVGKLFVLCKYLLIKMQLDNNWFFFTFLKTL